MTTDDNTKSAKISCRFYCELCDFGTCKKYNYDVHLESIKHKNNGLTTNNNKNKQQISKNTIHCLICEKSASAQSIIFSSYGSINLIFFDFGLNKIFSRVKLPCV